MNFEQFQQALNNFFISSNNETRKQAEEFLSQVPKQNFSEGIKLFVQGLNLENQQQAQLSASCLKQYYLDHKEQIDKLSSNEISFIIEQVQGALNDKKTYSFTQRCLEIIVKLYHHQSNQQNIMDLIKQLASTASNEMIKKSLMYLINISCEYSFDDDLLMKFAPELSQIFQTYLEDQSLEVRVSAFKSLTVFLNSIDNETLLKKFDGVFPLLLSKCIESLQQDSETGQQNIQSLVELCETHPKFAKPVLEDLINLFTEIISNSGFSDEIRIQGLNGITTLCSTNQSGVRKSETFKNKTVQQIMLIMTQVNKIPEDEWNSELNDEYLSSQYPSLMAIETIAKICPDLGVKFLLPIFIPYIKEAIQSAEWNHQFTALMTISMLVEGCSKYFESELTNILMMVDSLKSSQNPRVISALLKAYAFLAEEFKPDFQQQHGAQIIPFICQNLSHSILKVQFTAVQSMVTFLREYQEEDDEQKIVQQNAQNIITPITQIFQKAVSENNIILLEEVLSCISVVASSLQSNFEQYYQIYMDGLKQLLNNIPADNQNQINIRILTLECIGYIISSISKNQQLFESESKQLMNILLQMKEKLAKDDSHHSAIYVVMGQIAEGLGQKFKEYIPQIFQGVLDSIQQDNIAFLGNDAEKTQNTISKKIDLGMFGQFDINLNHTLLEQKIEGAHLLYKISKSLGKEFYSLIPQTLEVIKKYCSFKHSTDFRESCIKIVNNLLMACSTDTDMAQILNQIMPQLLEEHNNANQLKNTQQIGFIIEQLAENIKLFKSPLVEQKYIEQELNLISKSLQIGENLKKQIRKEYADEQQDQETVEQMEEEMDEVNEIMRASIEILGPIFKVYNTQVEGIMINTIIPHFFEYLKGTEALENEVFNTLYVFDEFMTYCSDEIYQKAYEQVNQSYLNICKNSKFQTPDVLQNAIYGFQVFAKRTQPQIFSNSVQNYLEIINYALSQEFENNEEYKALRDVSVGALGKISLLQLNDNAELKKNMAIQFLQKLPLKNDSEEAQLIHIFLFEQIYNKNQIINDPQVNEQVKVAVQNIQQYHQQNPQDEILNDEGLQKLQQII